MNDKKSNIMLKEITSDPKYEDIFTKLEKLFKTHGYFLRDTFDHQVWFLNEDRTFQAILNKLSYTPSAGMKIIEILYELNENGDKSNLNKLKVNVEKIIEKLCETLILCNNIINRSTESIKQYNAHEKKNIIEEKLKILSDKTSNSSTYMSKMKASIVELDYFAIGEYEFEIKALEFKQNSEQNTVINHKILKLRDTIKLSQDNEVVTFKNYEKNKNDYTFEDFDFRIFENKNLEDLFKHHSYSGSTFSNFTLKCLRKNKGITYESKAEFFLDIMLIFIDDLIDISKDVMNKNLHIKIKSSGNEEKTVVLEFKLELDPLTRSSLLKRVNEIFKGVIETKRMNIDVIEEILDSYYPEVSESIKNVLFKKPDDKRDACCNCVIY